MLRGSLRDMASFRAAYYAWRMQWYEFTERWADSVDLRKVVRRNDRRLKQIHQQRFTEEMLLDNLEPKNRSNLARPLRAMRRDCQYVEYGQYSFERLMIEYHCLLDEWAALDCYRTELELVNQNGAAEPMLDRLYDEMIILWRREQELRPKVAERESLPKLFNEHGVYAKF